MGITRRQHFVPRFYLARFASQRGQLYVYDKVKRRRLGAPVGIDNLAATNWLYDFPAEVQAELVSRIKRGEVPQADEEFVEKANDPQMIEHHLSEQEGYHAIVFTDLLDAIDKKARLHPVQRRIIAHFLIVQRMRTPAFGRTLMNAWKAAASGAPIFASGKLRKFALPPVEQKWERVVHANAFTSPDVLWPAVEELIGEVWRIGLNGTSRQLYTSDNPVIMMETLGDRAASFPIAGVRVVFPLTPKYLLFIFRQGAMSENTPMSLGDFSLTDEQAALANRLQVMNCTRQLYCSDDQFELAEAVARELR